MKKNHDPQLHQMFKPIRKFSCTFLLIYKFKLNTYEPTVCWFRLACFARSLSKEKEAGTHRLLVRASALRALAIERERGWCPPASPTRLRFRGRASRAHKLAAAPPSDIFYKISKIVIFLLKKSTQLLLNFEVYTQKTEKRRT